jgi:hypothetical protein
MVESAGCIVFYFSHFQGDKMRNLLAATILLLACTQHRTAFAQENTAAPQHIFDAANISNKTLTELTPGNSPRNSIHIFPTIQRAEALRAALATATPLVYHNGGRIMPSANIYVIFWLPPKLQNGTPSTLSKQYQDLQIRFMKDYPGHGVGNNSTQYYETISGSTNYILNAGQFVESYLDTAPYPASACKDTITPGNCITDAQIRSEIQRVMALKKWKGGLSNIYFVYTGTAKVRATTRPPIVVLIRPIARITE